MVASLPADATGTVIFRDEKDRIIGITSAADGRATFDERPLVTLEPGPHRLRATYAGNAAYFDATSAELEVYVLPSDMTGATFATINGPVAMPDPGVAESPITTSRFTGTTDRVVLNLDVKHSWRGDLRLELLSPTGAVFPVRDFYPSDSTDDVTGFYEVATPGQPKLGTWRLRATDKVASDSGSIRRWSISY
jgi:hypothetical protein